MTRSTLRATAFAALLLTAACATASGATPGATPAAAPATALDPAGTYTFSSAFRGQTFEGVVRIAPDERGGYAGTVTTPFTGEMPVRSVDVQGSRVRVTATGRAGDAVLEMDVRGSDFSGTWTYGPSTGQMTGRRAPAA
ncbi:MAG TPA: hypothetical protein VGC13_19610 [Longimicrobium sp.]|uniref:hypothetical protein n=1 Tax=Longimicrobium sp. TaxID=2029185 RepID=UPI002EDB3EE8